MRNWLQAIFIFIILALAYSAVSEPCTENERTYLMGSTHAGVFTCSN